MWNLFKYINKDTRTTSFERCQLKNVILFNFEYNQYTNLKYLLLSFKMCLITVMPKYIALSISGHCWIPSTSWYSPIDNVTCWEYLYRVLRYRYACVNRKKETYQWNFFNKNSDSFKPAISGKRTPPHNVSVKHPHKPILKRSKYSEIVAQRSSVKNVLKNFPKVTGKQLCLTLFNKVAGNFIKKRLQHQRRCFLVNFAKFFRIPLLAASEERES